jgi:hypothetical protein
MCRGAYRVEESGVGVRRKVHNQAGFRYDAASYLDVEHYLAVGAAGVAGGLIVGAVDAHRADVRRGKAEAAEVVIEVGLDVPAAQFDDRDRLAGPIRTVRYGVDVG